jgi:Phosphate transport regulator (distant homolog of PhoU)
MGFGLKPREEKFYGYLLENTQLIRDAAEILQVALNREGDLSELMIQIDELEKQADANTAKIVGLLHKSFITPLDREDIYAIAHKLDDVIDCVQGVIERMELYNAGTASDGAKELGYLVAKTSKQIDKAFTLLPDIKKQREKLEERCAKIIEFEALGDRLYRQEMAKLFRECTDPIEIIKWKEILLHLEETLDISEDIANLLKGVIVKYA